MNTSGARFLRPYLCKDVAASTTSASSRSAAATRSAYIRLFHASRRLKENKSEGLAEFPADVIVPFQVEERVKELKKSSALQWPRIERDGQRVTVKEFTDQYSHMQAFAKSNNHHTVQGKSCWADTIDAVLMGNRPSTKRAEDKQRLRVCRHRTGPECPTMQLQLQAICVRPSFLDQHAIQRVYGCDKTWRHYRSVHVTACICFILMNRNLTT